MIHLNPPPHFDYRTHVVAAFIESKGYLLFLQRNFDKPEGGLWGLPAGKVHKEESVRDALYREVREETDLRVHMLQDITLVRSVYVRWAQKDFTYHMFRAHCVVRPPISINVVEHCGYGWFTPSESFSLSSVPDQHTCTRLVYELPL